MNWRKKEPTERQHAGIRLIEKELGYTTRAKTRGGVSDFLDKYLPAAKREGRRKIMDGYDFFDDCNPGGKVG